MLRAGSVEIPMPNNQILLAAEQALFTEETATMKKMAELQEEWSYVPNQFDELEPDPWIQKQLEDASEHLVFVRRSLNWVRAARSSFLHEGDKDVK